MKLGEALKDQFEAVRKQLAEAEPEPRPLMGVVVPVGGFTAEKAVMLARQLNESASIIVVDAPRVSSPEPVSPLDEGQLAGELLEWLHKEGFIQPVNKLEVRRYHTLLDMQKAFFEDRDRQK
jgi:hypothetical protein